MERSVQKVLAQLEKNSKRARALEAAAKQRQRQTPPRTTSRPSAAAAPGRRLCLTCNGIGSETCHSCGGFGFFTSSYSQIDWQGNTEYVTEQTPCACAGGHMPCGACGGSGYR